MTVGFGYDKMDELGNDKQTYDELEIQRRHCNSNLTTNYINVKPTKSTFDGIQLTEL